MAKLPEPYVDDALERLSSRFSKWRESRTSEREPIPQPLWDEAVELSERLPLSRVAKRLRLSGGDLKRQRDRGLSRPTVRRRRREAPLPVSFVEVEPQAAGRVPNAEIEVHRADGSRLCLRFAGDAPIADLLQVFLAG